MEPRRRAAEEARPLDRQVLGLRLACRLREGQRRAGQPFSRRQQGRPEDGPCQRVVADRQPLAKGAETEPSIEQDRDVLDRADPVQRNQDLDPPLRFLCPQPDGPRADAQDA